MKAIKKRLTIARSKITIQLIKLAMHTSTWGSTYDRLDEALVNEQKYLYYWKD